MSEASKSARSAMKAKISRLVRTDPKIRVDASGYTPPDALDADVKTGLRPISRRQFRRGGKVFANEGIKTEPRADRKARSTKAGFGSESRARVPEYHRAKRADGGVVEKLENRDVRELNRDRVGSKHVGGFKNGGAPRKYSGGPVDVPAVKRAMKSAQRVGVDPQNSHDVQKKLYAKAAADKARRLAAKQAAADGDGMAGGGAAGRPSAKRPIYDADTDGGGSRRARARGGATTNDPPEDSYGSPHGTEAVNRTSLHQEGGHSAAEYSGPASRKRAALRMHTVRRARADGGEVEKPRYWDSVKDRVKEIFGTPDTAAPKGIKNPVATGNPEQPYEGVGGKAREDAVMGAVDDAVNGTPKRRGGAANIAKLQVLPRSGGREARAHGGRAKGKTNINIIIGAPKAQPMPVPVPAGAPPMPPPGGAGMHQGAPPPMAPPGAMPPPAPPMARRAGGRVATGLGFDRKTAAGPGSTAPPMTHAAGGGLGRLQKVKTYGARRSREA